MAVVRRNAANPPTPGEVLRELIEGEIDQGSLAVVLGVTRYSINQLVNGKRAVTAAMALRLAKAFNTTPEFWLDLQRKVDLDRARRHLARSLKAIRPLRPAVSADELFYDIHGS